MPCSRSEIRTGESASDQAGRYREFYAKSWAMQVEHDMGMDARLLTFKLASLSSAA